MQPFHCHINPRKCISFFQSLIELSLVDPDTHPFDFCQIKFFIDIMYSLCMIMHREIERERERERERGDLSSFTQKKYDRKSTCKYDYIIN